ncbi:MAG: gamma-glutamyl-gamma-aminobutyrate hydrolase family protein [Bacteroidales bacterium]|nr:gamma-glutamyl-gamma-aminobutyrate hydrolase family protein [Bacteroidales bacterium]
MKNNKLFLPIILILFSFLLPIFFQSCNSVDKHDSIKIAISKAKPEEYYVQYENWLKATDSTIECVDMYHIRLDSALMIFENCDGLLLTGGPDVFPGRYDQAFDTSRCGEIDYKRDTLEFALIKKALELKMPILGVCRGEQILNIAMGGSLIVDIPTDFDTSIIHRCEDTYNCEHDIIVVKNSLLNKICQTGFYFSNSNHHQAVNELADCFVASAFTHDSLIEAIEWKKPEGKSFLIAVQWHPERLSSDNTLSYPIAERFLEEAKKYGVN